MSSLALSVEKRGPSTVYTYTPHAHTYLNTQTCMCVYVHKPAASLEGPGSWERACTVWIFFTVRLFRPVEFCFLGRDYMFKKMACLPVPHSLRLCPPGSTASASRQWMETSERGDSAWCSALSSGAGFGGASGATLAFSRAGRGSFLLWDLPAFSIPTREDKRCPCSRRSWPIGPEPAHSPHSGQKPEGCWGHAELADGYSQDLGSCPQVPGTQGRSHGRWSWRPADPAASGWLNLHF